MLSDVTTTTEMKDLVTKLNKMHLMATHGKTRESASNNERQLLAVIDYLLRVPNMLAGMIEEELERELITHDPMKYTQSKLNSAYINLEEYLKLKGLDLNEND